MLLWTTAIVAGLVLLVWSADRFVIGAAAFAKNLGVPTIIIGLTIVGFGTSAPEIMVSVISALEGTPQLAIGNALGSNIANIALILGITALFIPLTVSSSILRREYPLLLGSTLVAGLLIFDNELSVFDGVILLTLLIAVMIRVVYVGLNSPSSDPIQQDFDKELQQKLTTKMAVFWLLAGLVTMVIASQLLVWGASEIAHSLGVSDLIIGLTIVAFGTSLPELATCISSAMKKEYDIAVGNIIGSNLFNSLAVLGLPAVIHPTLLSTDVFSRDYALVLVLTLALLVMAYGHKGHGRINRFEGAILLTMFVGYQVVLYQQTIGS
ncbi:MAG: calcium/sodium antiporter [Gammaproteobacteria bacterium]|nr:calcium/sodium antiporter [Gammaproteobacteria bacterium]